MFLGRYGSREIMDFQIFDYATKAPYMTFDYATSVQVENNAETVYARGGKGNPRRISWHGDKETAITVETQIFTMQHLALLAGEKIVSGSSELYKNEVLPVVDDGNGEKIVVVSKPPVGDVDEIAVYSIKNGVLLEPQAVVAVNGNEISLSPLSTVNFGDEVSVYYRWNVSQSHKLSFTASGYPPYVFMVGDTEYPEEISGAVAYAQIKYYRAKLQPNFTISYAPSGDPATLSLVFDVFPVKIEGKDTLYDMILYED